MAFSLSLLFIVLFALAYILSADIVASASARDTGNFFEVWLPPILVGLAASLVCTGIMFVIKTKRMVPVAFTLLALYYVLGNVLLRILLHDDTLPTLLQVLRLYMLPPVIIGNLLAWIAYRLFYWGRA